MALGDGRPSWESILNVELPGDRTQHDLLQQLMAQAPDMFSNQSLAQQQAQMQWAQAQQAVPKSPTPKPPNPPLGVRAKELFLKRMGGIRAEMTLKSDDFLQMHVRDDTVYMFYCLNGKDGVVKEQVDLFPSDQLIAQFRMILA